MVIVMNKFIEIPANNLSISMRKPICGIAINDSSYITEIKVDGKRVVCPIYRAWSNMIRRCYYANHQGRDRSYKGCSVSSEWLKFSNFRGWMVRQNWRGKHLDKDIAKNGNKVYSSDNCIFVTREINNMLTSRKASRNGTSVGVSLTKGRYTAFYNTSFGRTHLGTFSNNKEAHEAYLAFKSKHVLKVANEQNEPLKSYLIRISKEIADGEYY